jgi:hypothetical protein
MVRGGMQRHNDMGVSHKNTQKKFVDNIAKRVLLSSDKFDNEA